MVQQSLKLRCEFKKHQKTPHSLFCTHRSLYNKRLELVYIKQMVHSNARRLQLPENKGTRVPLKHCFMEN